ncbi:unnamed protein product [Mytilus edulis]|uniref:Reverse transcriptase domain-containing protein n=1 Tax=Mytilus edulis TaxID=6550 RepID=A0A8S3QSL8_MYTED|nr:unnamed protein product [Mytilus edulis]
MTKKDAQNKWSEDLCEKIGEAKSLREKWSNFKKLTKKKSENLVHPLQGNNGNILFTESEKSNILKNTFFEGYHLKANNFNQQFYDDITQQYISISTSNQEENTDNIKYNDYITMEELEGSIFKLKKESAPGPDFFFTELFINGGSELKSKLLDIINQSWEEGIIPLNWRRANVKFIKKLYKPNYNLPSSYRPISLTSVVAKLMERIITYRLEGFVEMNNIMDQEQEGFRHFRGTTNALLSLTQAIFNGFNKDKTTIVIFIDFEKAYDSVWREGLMVKLYNDGIKGKMWMWINAFLSHREARCMTAVSLQMMQLFGTHIQIQKLYKKTAKDLNQVQKWSNDWRMKLSIQKTEYSIFSKEKNKVQNIKLKLGNTILKYNPNPVILGLKLDEQLNFNSHIESTVKKAKRSLGIIREIKGIALIPTKTLIQIYDSLVCSIFNYASSIWQSSTSSHLDKLNEIQRKGLALCLDLPSQSSLEALEVLSGTLPIDLRREEMAIRELGKINSYSNNVPIKRKFEIWKRRKIQKNIYHH